MATSKQKIDLKSLIKVYWSISWRANVLGLTVYLTLFALFPILLTYLVHINYLENFREFLFGVYHIPEVNGKLGLPSFPQIISAGTIAFIFDYCFFLYGFNRIIKLKLYTDLLPESRPFATYNKIFLAPLLIYDLWPGDVIGIPEIPSFIFAIVIYFGLAFYLLRKVVRR